MVVLTTPTATEGLTEEQAQTFLGSLTTSGGHIRAAARSAGVGRRDVYVQRAIDKAFASRMDAISRRRRVGRLWEASCEIVAAADALHRLGDRGDYVDVIINAVFGADVDQPSEILAARQRVGDARLAWARELIATYDSQDANAGRRQANRYSLRDSYVREFEQLLEEDQVGR